jgi:hypothetical protein
MLDPGSAEDQPLVPSCRVSRVMAKPGRTGVTVKDLHERLCLVRGLPTLWEGLQRLFHLQRDEIVVMPLTLLRECEREAGPAPVWIKGIVGLRDVFILHRSERSERARLAALPEIATRPAAPAVCDACGAQSLSNFYSSRELRRTLCPPCYDLRTPQISPSPSPAPLKPSHEAGATLMPNDE